MPRSLTDSTIYAFRGTHFLSDFYEIAFDVPMLGEVRTSEHAFNALKSADPLEQRSSWPRPRRARRNGVGGTCHSVRTGTLARGSGRCR